MTSIIIPCRYRPDLTQVCIDSIQLYTKDYEIIAVQEGEDKEITKLLKSYNIKFVQNKTPKGYAGALNTGMELATGDTLCFMNNDIVATPNWLSEMLKAIKDEENVGLVSPTFWGTGERQSIEWNDGRRFDFVNEPFSLIGVCFLIPRYVMEQLENPKGKWDEDFFHGGEDFDLTMRIYNDLNYQLVIARKSFLYHYCGASTRELHGNNLIKLRDYHIKKVNQLIKKHNLDAEDVYQRLRIKKIWEKKQDKK